MQNKKKKKRIVFILMVMDPALSGLGSAFPEQDKKEENIKQGEVG